jgi:hypothetical protein
MGFLPRGVNLIVVDLNSISFLSDMISATISLTHKAAHRIFHAPCDSDSLDKVLELKLPIMAGMRQRAENHGPN